MTKKPKGMAVSEFNNKRFEIGNKKNKKKNKNNFNLINNKKNNYFYFYLN